MDLKSAGVWIAAEQSRLPFKCPTASYPHGSPSIYMKTPLSVLRLPLRSDASGCRTLEPFPSLQLCLGRRLRNGRCGGIVEPPSKQLGAERAGGRNEAPNQHGVATAVEERLR